METPQDSNEGHKAAEEPGRVPEHGGLGGLQAGPVVPLDSPPTAPFVTETDPDSPAGADPVTFGRRWDDIYSSGYSGHLSRESDETAIYAQYPGYSPPAPPGDDPASVRRRGLILALVIALGLVAIAGGGIAIGASLGNNSSSSANNSGTGSAPVPKSINVASVASKVEPSIVDITSNVSSTAGGGRDAGTGMIISTSGEVLTNNHVVYDATSITAQIDGKGTTYTARVLGVDPTQDVALIQLENASGLPAVTLGNSSGVKIGDEVVAIGNALALTGPPTVTEGIVSALNRSITASDAGSLTLTEHLHGLIQTDAPINPGNSGGPLVNAAGQVIGMTTANASGSPSQTATNIGFAIPIDTAVRIATQIRDGRSSSTIEIGEQGFIGVGVNTVSQAESNPVEIFGGAFGAKYTAPVNVGAVVTQIVAGAPAAEKGIVVGDVITQFNGHTIGSPIALHDAVGTLLPNATTSISWVDLNGQRHSSRIKLAVKPFD